MTKLRLRDLTDEEVLLSLLQNPSKLDTFEKKVFEEWLGAAEKGRTLTDKQRDMSRRKFEVLGLIEQFDRDNLASARKLTGAKINYASREEFEASMGPRCAAPPRPKFED